MLFVSSVRSFCSLDTVCTICVVVGVFVLEKHVLFITFLHADLHKTLVRWTLCRSTKITMEEQYEGVSYTCRPENLKKRATLIANWSWCDYANVLPECTRVWLSTSLFLDLDPPSERGDKMHLPPVTNWSHLVCFVELNLIELCPAKYQGSPKCSSLARERGVRLTFSSGCIDCLFKFMVN